MTYIYRNFCLGELVFSDPGPWKIYIEYEENKYKTYEEPIYRWKRIPEILGILNYIVSRIEIYPDYLEIYLLKPTEMHKKEWKMEKHIEKEFYIEDEIYRVSISFIPIDTSHPNNYATWNGRLILYMVIPKEKKSWDLMINHEYGSISLYHEDELYRFGIVEMMSKKYPSEDILRQYVSKLFNISSQVNIDIKDIQEEIGEYLKLFNSVISL